MDFSDPRWRTFGQNLLWFVATILFLLVMLRLSRSMAAVVLPALWIIALGWGGLLVYQASRLLFGAKTGAVDEAQARAYLEQARDYQTKIGALLNSGMNPGNELQRQRLAEQVETWIEKVEALVQRMGNMRGDATVQRDIQVVPEAIQELEGRLAGETDPTMQRQLERTLANRRKQLEALQELERAIERAEVQIESTLSQLGTIYSQLLTGQSTSDAAIYHRLSAEIDEEVDQLQDRLEALREVKEGRGDQDVLV